MNYGHLTPEKIRTNGYGIDSITHFALQKNPIKYRYLLSKDDNELGKEIFEAVLEIFDVQKEVLESKCRKRHLVFVRQIFCYVTKTISGLSLKSIGEFIGDRDHTTVIHSVKTIRDLIDANNYEFAPYWRKWTQNAPNYLIP